MCQNGTVPAWSDIGIVWGFFRKRERLFMNKFIATMVSVVILGGCASQGEIMSPQSRNETTIVKDIYKIGAGDALSVSVWKNPELSVQVPVRPDGKISVPLIGDHPLRL